MSTTSQRYTAVAVLLHWAIAVAIAGQILLGWWMGEALDNSALRAQAFAAFQLHKSIGLTILLLSLIRLGWRLLHRPPPLPEHMSAWERVAALSTHWAFYALIVLMPLTGWLYVSAGWSAHDNHAFDVPTYYFGLFHVPHLFNLDHGPDAMRSALAQTTMSMHSAMAWILIVLAALHVAAALKHHFYDRDEVLTHMIPGLRARNAQIPVPPANPARRNLLAGGFALIGVAALGAIFAFVNPPRAATAPASGAPVVASREASSPAPAPPPAATTPAPVSTAQEAPSAPPAWTVDHAHSAISFAGAVAGENFTGGFSSWRAEIRFDAGNLEQSRAAVTIETGSIHTGDAQRDEALPQGEWFDVAGHPSATFRTSAIRALGGDSYEARGTLSLKGVSQAVRLPFTLIIRGDRAIMDGHVELDRLALDLGKSSFPDDSTVARAVRVDVHVEATRAP
ncbi:MAG TPA: YceI family protein [Caulobacterales bacterium]|nr:YceI family protein [Caulobacterales bacterium]